MINDLKKEIRFESVAFGYPERPPIFNDVTFRIPVASTTAIVGKSGCGKSTIAHLLLRLSSINKYKSNCFSLYTPTMGRIVIDDHDLRELDPSGILLLNLFLIVLFSMAQNHWHGQPRACPFFCHHQGEHPLLDRAGQGGQR